MPEPIIISAADALKLAEQHIAELNFEAERECNKILPELDKLIRSVACNSSSLTCRVDTTLEILNPGTAERVKQKLEGAGYTVVNFSHPKSMGPEGRNWSLQFIWG